MRFALLLLTTTACGVAPSPAEVPEPSEAAPAEVAAEIYVLEEGYGEAVLYWPSLRAARPIPVRSNPGAPEQPWTGPVPPGQSRAMSVWVDPGDLVEIRQRVATAGLPSLAPPSLVEIDAGSFPGMSLGLQQLSWTVSHGAMVGTTATHVHVVRVDGPRVTLAVQPGQEVEFVSIASATLTPRDQDLPSGGVALDAVVDPAVTVGSPVRLIWPEGADIREDVADGGYLYLGNDERGWAVVSTLRYEKHLVSLRAEWGPPRVVPDERVAFVVPLTKTPDASRMTQTTHLTDGRLRSTDYSYAAVGDRSITVLVPADDVEWLQYWLEESGGRLSLAGIRMIDRSGFDPPPPGFPPSTRLRR